MKNKKYVTVEGNYPLRILAEDLKNEPYPVLIAVIKDEDTERLVTLTKDLKDYDSVMFEPYIREVSPYEDFKIDEPVLVWGGTIGFEDAKRRYFAGISGVGGAKAFSHGTTSWTQSGVRCWEHCRRFTVSDLNDEA